MSIQYLKKAIKNSSSDETKTREIVQNLLTELEKTKEEGCKELTKKFDKYEGEIIISKEKINADVFGPLAFDNSVSKKSAAIKGIKNIVAGQADILLVPNVEAGNGLVKMMIYFMGACAAGIVIGGKVPIVITSRSDEAAARLASMAAAVVALNWFMI